RAAGIVSGGRLHGRVDRDGGHGHGDRPVRVFGGARDRRLRVDDGGAGSRAGRLGSHGARDRLHPRAGRAHGGRDGLPGTLPPGQRRRQVTPDLVFALSLLGITVGAFVQAATGMGFSLVSAPLLIMYLGPREGVAAVVVLAALSSLLPLARDGRHAQPGAVARLLIPTLLCTPLIAWGLADVDTRWLALVAGLGVIVAVGILASGVRWK